MGGEDLDRFSRYSFGTFDNRLRGYPSASHDPGFGRGLRNYTGAGAAVEAPLPFGTLLAVEWGYGFRGVNGNGTLGTQVLRISGYKVF